MGVCAQSLLGWCSPWLPPQCSTWGQALPIAACAHQLNPGQCTASGQRTASARCCSAPLPSPPAGTAQLKLPCLPTCLSGISGSRGRSWEEEELPLKGRGADQHPASCSHTEKSAGWGPGRQGCSVPLAFSGSSCSCCTALSGVGEKASAGRFLPQHMGLWLQFLATFYLLHPPGMMRSHLWVGRQSR